MKVKEYHSVVDRSTLTVAATIKQTINKINDNMNGTDDSSVTLLNRCEMKTHGREWKRLPKCNLKYAAMFLFLLALSSLVFLLRNIETLKSIFKSQPTFNLHCHDSGPWSAAQGPELTPEDALEERSLMESIRWPEPPPSAKALHFSQTSDPAHSHFTILPAEGAEGWRVGGRLEALVQMRDFQGQPKRYGGDFLLARLHDPSLQAGVAGRVVDHLNGYYSVVFPLLWEGRAQVEVTLVHPSEAISVLQRLTKEQPGRVFFHSVFRSGSVSEKTVCNVCLPPSPQRTLCNYTNLQTGEPWYCYKPDRLSCEDRIDHAMGGFMQNITTDEQKLFQRRINMKVYVKNASGSDSVIVLPKEKDKPELKAHNDSKVATGPSGYYYQGVWRALGGGVTVEHFPDASAINQCLKNKHVFIYGDSTSRQYFDFFTASLPDLKEFDLYNPKTAGPRMSLDSSRNIMVNFRVHGPPLRVFPISISQLHYVANELDSLAGGTKTVVLLSVWAHFGTFPVEVYIRRLRGIRRAVVRLLRRAPGTTVVVRTANLTAMSNFYEVLNNSDWYGARRDAVLRAMFGGLLGSGQVVLLDAWDMTLAHSLPHILHPEPPIIQNMVDVVLSNVCPRQRVV